MISITLVLEQDRIRRAANLSVDAAKLGVDVAGDVGKGSVKAGSHVYRHKDKYGFAALGAGTALAARHGYDKVKKAFD